MHYVERRFKQSFGFCFIEYLLRQKIGCRTEFRVSFCSMKVVVSGSGNSAWIALLPDVMNAWFRYDCTSFLL